jgi:tyrosyl-tRNA synthetase
MSLAYEITKLYSSVINAKNAEERFKSVFQQNVVPEDAPIIEIKKSNGNEIEQIINELVSNKYYKSKSEIRRVLEQGGVVLNGERVQSAKDVQLENGDQVIKIGKRNFFKIIVK